MKHFVILPALFIGAFISASSAQIVLSNSLVTYTYEQSAGNAFVPSTPLAPSSPPDSTLSFFPGGFAAGNSGSAWNIDTFSSVLTVTMDANPGTWFTNNAFRLSAQVNYSLVAPTATSTAGISASAPFTLYLTEVDGSPFGSPGLLLTNALIFTPAFVETTGPASFPTGQLSGNVTLTLNTIKAHFGIGATNNITGMRVQLSPVVSAWSERGSASASLVNVDIGNQVVPEPSTYALLALAASGLGIYALRRRAKR